MKVHLLTSTKVAALAAAILSSTAAAALTYNPGDLFLGFHQPDPNLNSAQDFIIDIGPASTFRDATTPQTLTLTGLNSQLTSLFGGTWKTDGTVYWGFVGTPGAGAANSDPAETLYASGGAVDNTPANTPKPSPNSSQAGPEGKIISMKNYYLGLSAVNTNGSVTNSKIGATSNANSYGARISGTFGTGDLGPIEDVTNNPFGIDLFRVPQGSSATVTNEGRFTFGATDQVLFTPVPLPEPSTLLFGASAGLVLCLRRYRRADSPSLS